MNLFVVSFVFSESMTATLKVNEYYSDWPTESINDTSIV